MISWTSIVCAVLMLTSADTCVDQFAEYGQQNVQLVFTFTWISTEPIKVNCYKESIIGQCRSVLGELTCDLISDTYKLSSNSDVTLVTVTIATFRENQAGKYRCNKDQNSEYERSICIEKTETLTSVNMFPQAAVLYNVYTETSTFECTTSTSRPRSSIQWFEDARNVTHMANDTYSSGVVRSVLTYVPQSQGVMNLSCVANYVYKDKSVSLRDSATLKVQFPVSKPTIKYGEVSITNQSSFRDGRLVEFRCFSLGYPPPSYHWTFAGGESNNTVVKLQFSRNNGSIACTASNNYLTLNGTLSTRTSINVTSVSINVLYPPSIKSLKNSDLGILLAENNIRVIRGDNISIACDSDANPPATVFWMGQQVNSSTLTVKGIQQNTTWTCIASNTLAEANGVTSNETVTRFITATVLYGPVVPTITFNVLPISNKSVTATNETIRVIEGSNVSLMCYVNSIPSSVHSWNDGHEGSILSIYNVTKATAKSFTCNASNTMDTTFKGNVTASNCSSIHLELLYGPENITLRYNNLTVKYQELKVIKYMSFTLSCFASSNPAPTYSWFGSGVQEGNDLRINNVSSDINKNISCRAVNTMIDSIGHSVSKTTQVSVILDVLYEPVLQRLQNQTVQLNTSLTLNCNLTNKGNPPATNFTWIKKSNNTVVRTGQTLELNSVQLSDEGEYQCRASNEMQPFGNGVVYGLSQSTLFINVEYGAYIRLFKANGKDSTIIVEQGDTINFVCDTDGDPEPVVRIVNATRENGMTNMDSDTSNETSQINSARCEYDAGRYTCLASNKYNTVSLERSLDVFVKCSPRASPFSPPVKDVYSAANDSAIFTFTIKAYPKPMDSNYSWYKRVAGDWMDISSDANLVTHVSDDQMQTQLNITRVQIEDYTEYMVNVSNILGSTAEVFTLHPQSPPEVPKELHVSQVGKTELVVGWTPGFNGGKDQNFTIRYKAVYIISWIDIYVSNYDDSNFSTIGGLRSSTTYTIKMRAENQIGKSDWTEEITSTTLRLVDEDKNGSVAPAIGGAIGGVLGIGIIATILVLIWRHRSKALADTDPKRTLTKRSIKHTNGTYVNVGMLTPELEMNTTKQIMASSCSSKDLVPSREHPSTLELDINKPNIQTTWAHAVESIPHHDTKQISSKHKSVVADISRPPIPPPKEQPILHRRDSFAVEYDPIYDNLYKKKKQFKSREISVPKLRETVVQDKDNKTDVFTEYSALNVASENISYPTNAAIKPNNTSKNRYKRMYPYDKNRITLTVIGDDTDTDFINASFIDGYSSPRRYIAAQGPLANTIADFWRMIWEQNVQVVIMVTNLVEELKKKCFQYWPNGWQNNCQFSDMTVQLVADEIYADFTIRTFRCTKANSTEHRVVTQLHFTAWPDKDVPDTALSLKQFWRKVRNMEISDQSPWIVHCSAGVGRTGTFIALDYLYDQGVSEKQINVFECVLLLREQRINMVQTKNQYLYLHEVLFEALCPFGDILTNKDYIENKCSPDSLNQEYHNMCQSQIPDREEGETDGVYIKIASGETPENLNKNFDPYIVPDDKYRPLLNVNIIAKGHNDYINAVYISTFREKNKLILTQSAQTSSDLDFVRLLHEHYVKTVITLCDEVEPYIPESGRDLVIGPYTASLVSNAQKQNFQECVVRFKHIGENEYFDVQIFRFTKWSSQYDVCKTNELLCLLSDVQENTSSEATVVIQCRDGYSRSGLVAVLWCLMERSKRDGEVAVAETVRVIRRRREQVIKNEAQYRFCHEFMKEYIQGCLVYANT